MDFYAVLTSNPMVSFNCTKTQIKISMINIIFREIVDPQADGQNLTLSFRIYSQSLLRSLKAQMVLCLNQALHFVFHLTKFFLLILIVLGLIPIFLFLIDVVPPLDLFQF